MLVVGLHKRREFLVAGQALHLWAIRVLQLGRLIRQEGQGLQVEVGRAGRGPLKEPSLARSI
eukprot:12492488-Alexandrium_andersonii.AAC.1